MCFTKPNMPKPGAQPAPPPAEGASSLILGPTSNNDDELRNQGVLGRLALRVGRAFGAGSGTGPAGGLGSGGGTGSVGSGTGGGTGTGTGTGSSSSGTGTGTGTGTGGGQLSVGTGGRQGTPLA